MPYDADGRPDGYDSSYQPPDWWMKAFRKVVDAQTHAVIAASASAAMKRTHPWDASRITKFAQGKNRTLQLTWGISRALGIPQPIFEAGDEREARALQNWLDDRRSAVSDARRTPTDEKLADVRKVVGSIEERAQAIAVDQSTATQSGDALQGRRSRQAVIARKNGSRGPAGRSPRSPRRSR